jgi:hypothetical protein
MKRPMRQLLADSHVAAVTIAILLLCALDAAFRGLWDPVYRMGNFLCTAIAIRDIPSFPPAPTTADRLMLISTVYFLYSAVVSLAAAWILSRWIYGKGPLRSLITCRRNLSGRKHA